MTRQFSEINNEGNTLLNKIISRYIATVALDISEGLLI